MNILDLKLDEWYIVSFKINWIALIILLFVVFLFILTLKKCIPFSHKHSITISEINLGIGKSNIKLQYNKKDQEIAYKLWVELSTRKIGLPFDQEYDVIVEIYDSWYHFFDTARKLLKEIPIDRVLYASELIQLTEKVLNIGLRPHLTKWQAKFRKWYKKASEGSEEPPQNIQRSYPEYTFLIEDLLTTNKKMIEYKKIMEKIAFQKQ